MLRNREAVRTVLMLWQDAAPAASCRGRLGVREVMDNRASACCRRFTRPRPCSTCSQSPVGPGFCFDRCSLCLSRYRKQRLYLSSSHCDVVLLCHCVVH